MRDGGSGSDRGLHRILAHIEKAKATQPESNTQHHRRWVVVRQDVESGNLGAAREYAREWAAKGWKAWVELVEMLEAVK